MLPWRPGTPVFLTQDCDVGDHADLEQYASSTKRPTLPVSFAEWPDAASCADRRIEMPAR